MRAAFRLEQRKYESPKIMSAISFFYIRRGGETENFKEIYKICLLLFILGLPLLLFLVSTKQIGAQEALALESGDSILSKKNEIFNLTIESGDLPGYVSLRWQVRTENTSPIIIKRYSRPMSTMRLLQKGERVNPQALAPQAASYTDRLVSPGVYYYAVVTEAELRTPERLALVERGNYTHKAFIISTSLKPADVSSPAKEKEHPKELIAVNTKKSVLLSWAPTDLEIKDLSYEVYRASQPLDTKEALKKAKLLGKTKGSRPQFEDSAPLSNQDVYYGVIISGALEWSDFKPLELGKSYIKHRYIEELPEIDELLAINTQGSVLLTWTPRSSSRKTRYRIYRSPASLDSKKALEAAQLLGTTKSHRPQYRDRKPLVNKDVYYGLLVIEEGKVPELKGLVLNKSYIKHRYVPEVLMTMFGQDGRAKKGLKAKSLLDLILAHSYFKGQYRRCIRQVNVFLEHADLDEDVEAKGNFFLGLCHYKAKSYRDAMEFFSVPLVKKKYPVRARFWFERSIRRP